MTELWHTKPTISLIRKRPSPLFPHPLVSNKLSKYVMWHTWWALLLGCPFYPQFLFAVVFIVPRISLLSLDFALCFFARKTYGLRLLFSCTSLPKLVGFLEHWLRAHNLVCVANLSVLQRLVALWIVLWKLALSRLCTIQIISVNGLVLQFTHRLWRRKNTTSFVKGHIRIQDPMLIVIELLTAQLCQRLLLRHSGWLVKISVG